MTEADVDKGVRFICPCQIKVETLPEGKVVKLQEPEYLLIHNDGRHCFKCNICWVVCVRCGDVTDAKKSSYGGSRAFGTGHYCDRCNHEIYGHHRGICLKEHLKQDLKNRKNNIHPKDCPIYEVV